MSSLPYSQLIDKFSSVRIAVVGDIMLDRYIWGDATRISQEAPVPVVAVTRENDVPGGAANVVRNLLSLGGQAFCLGHCGNDIDGEQLLSHLRTAGAEVSNIIRDQRATTVKTRVIASKQQVVRIDREDTSPLTSEQSAQLLANLRALLDRQAIDGIIFEDYAKGVFSREFMAEALALASKANCPTMLDPHSSHPFDVKGLTLMTPNRQEAFCLAGQPFCPGIGDPLHDKPLCETGRILMERWGCELLLITLGAEGMILFSRQNDIPFHIPTRARQVFDVSGAGDTVMATMSLAMLAGASPADAADLANHAAGYVVGIVGTAAITAEQLKSAI